MVLKHFKETNSYLFMSVSFDFLFDLLIFSFMFFFIVSLSFLFSFHTESELTRRMAPPTVLTELTRK